MRSSILLLTFVASYNALVIRQRVPACPEMDGEDSIYLPSYENCSQFYQCTNGFAQILDCPAGLFFDFTLNVCNHAENEDSANCASHLLTQEPAKPSTQAPTEPPTEPSTKPTEPPTTVDCPPVDGEFAIHIPHPTDCTVFYKCDRGTPVLQSCPAGLWYNAALEVCDNPIDSGCLPK